MLHHYRVLVGVVSAAVGLFFTIYLLHAFLVIDNRRPSDVILVPAGDFQLRSSAAVRLAQQGFGRTVIVDEGTDSVTFGHTLAEHRGIQVRDLPAKVTICPIHSETTFGESRDASVCLAPLHPKRILLVTSDFHTRHSLLAFGQAIPGISFSVAAVPTDYSVEPWWHLGGLETIIEESAAFAWWKWRS